MVTFQGTLRAEDKTNMSSVSKARSKFEAENF